MTWSTFFLPILLFLLSCTLTLSNPVPGSIADLLLPSPKKNVVLEKLFPPRLQRAETAIVIRFATLVAATRYEVIAACDPVALSFFGTKDFIPKRLCSDLDSIAILISLLHFHVMSSEHPEDAVVWGAHLTDLGLDVSDQSRDINTATGWARVTGERLVNYFKNDGWNSLGDQTKDDYRNPFEDPSGYIPKNRADLKPDELICPLRWQPLTYPSDGHGEFASQVHVVPHIGNNAKPLVITPEEVQARTVESPYSEPNREETINPEDTATVEKHIDDLFERSKNLTPDQVKLVYWWESQFYSLGAFLLSYENILVFTRQETYRLFFGEMLAQHDSLIVAWKEKRRHDLARPTTLIKRLRTGKKVMAYRGHAKGVGLMKAEEWEAVLPVQPHSEFPSGYAALCEASMEHLDAGMKGVILDANQTLPPFHLLLTDLFTPLSPVKKDVKVIFNTPKDAARSCGESRLLGGMHFTPAVEAGYKLGEGIGSAAYKHVADLFEGRVPKDCARCLNK